MVLRIGRFALLAVLAGFAGLVLHEVLGHALPAWLFGATDVAITLNPDFTGRVGYSLEGLAPWKSAVVDAGGLVVNLVTGLLALPLAALVARRAPQRHALRLFLVLFGAISVYKALEYSAMSYFYGGPGDPLEHAAWCTVWHPMKIWAIPLVLLPFAMHAFGRAFMQAHAAASPGARSFLAAVLVAAPTLVLGGAFYYRASLPVVGEGEGWRRAREEAKARYCHLDPRAVHAPFPMLPVVAVLAAGGAVVGAFRARRASGVALR